MFLPKWNQQTKVRLPPVPFRGLRPNLGPAPWFGRRVKFRDRLLGFAFDFSDVGLYDLDLFLNILAVFLLATIGFAFESAELLFERANFIDGLFHHCHQVQFLAIREFESPDELRQLDSRTAEIPKDTPKRCLFCLRSHSVQFHAEGIYLFIRLVDLADNVQAFQELLFNFVIGQFLVTKLQNIFDDTGIFLQLVSQRNDFADDDRRPRQRLQYRKVAALDTFGDHDFAVAGKQRDRSHLAEVNPYGIVGFLKRARREV